MPFKAPVASAPMVPYVRDCVRCTHPQAPIVCKRCQCVAYCSADHQKADTQRHRKQCKPVADTRKTMDQEEQALLKEDPHAFHNVDGWFHLIYETRPYVRAKYAYIKALSEVGTFLATEMALKEAKELMFLNRGDNMAVRDVVPALLLLLGRMQEAYDFIRFWATHDDDEGEGGVDKDDEDDGEREDEDEDMDEDDDVEEEKKQNQPAKCGKGKTLLTRNEITGVAPCFQPCGADMFEPLDVFLKPHVDSVFHKCALTYIKTVIYHALTGAIRKLSDGDETEKTQVLEFLTQNKLPSDVLSLRELASKVFEQAVQAFRLTHEKNNHFWRIRNQRETGYVGADWVPHPRSNEWFLERKPWETPYAELWRAEEYKVHFLFAVLMSRDGPRDENENTLVTIYARLIEEYRTPSA